MGFTYPWVKSMPLVVLTSTNKGGVSAGALLPPEGAGVGLAVPPPPPPQPASMSNDEQLRALPKAIDVARNFRELDMVLRLLDACLESFLAAFSSWVFVQ